MKVRLLSKKHPLAISLAAFVLGVILVLVIQKVFAASTLITACVKTSTGSIRIVPANTTCASNEQFLSWNQQGVQGDPGPQGPQGVQGTQGPQGVPGPVSGPFSTFYVCPNCNFTSGGYATVGNLFKGKDFTNAYLIGAIFGNTTGLPNPPTVDMSNANFTNADLTLANFSHVIGTPVNFTGAKLEGTDFEFANLPSANFTNADLTPLPSFGTSNPPVQVNFSNAILTGANFTGTDTSNVIWSNTTCPDGTNSDSSSPSSCAGHL